MHNISTVSVRTFKYADWSQLSGVSQATFTIFDLAMNTSWPLGKPSLVFSEPRGDSGASDKWFESNYVFDCHNAGTQEEFASALESSFKRRGLSHLAIVDTYSDHDNNVEYGQSDYIVSIDITLFDDNDGGGEWLTEK